MNRVEFKLTMPNRGSWNGRWSGEEYNYTITRRMNKKQVSELGITKEQSNSWSYDFKDGWRAQITARIVVGKRPKSHGFRGYDWMVDSILINGEIKWKNIKLI